MSKSSRVPKAVIDWDRKIIFAGASHIRRGEDDGFLVSTTSAGEGLPLSRLKWCTSGWTSGQLLTAILESGNLNLSGWSVLVWIGTNDISQAGTEEQLRRYNDPLSYQVLELAAQKYQTNMTSILSDLYHVKKVDHVFLVTPNPWRFDHCLHAHKLITSYLNVEAKCSNWVSVIDLYKACWLRQPGGKKGKYVDKSLLKEIFEYGKSKGKQDGKHLSRPGYNVFVCLLNSAFQEWTVKSSSKV
jgi:lysophospholipase L1-like esterase